MVKTYGEGVSSYTIDNKWSAEFRRGKDSIQDDPRPGKPTNARTKT